MSDCEDCGLDIPPCRDVFAVGRRIWHREARRTQEVVVGDDKQKKDWVKVVAPQRWRPTKPGATLEGVFISKSTRPGDNGTVYGVVTVSTKAGTFAVAGAVISSLFEAAGCSPGTSVRIVFLGDRTSASGRWYRDYDLFLAKEEFGA